MNSYITDLLSTNSRLIVPDFGAFIVKQKHPKVIVFNEFLRYNDGLLTDYVASKENIEKIVAKEKITVFVDELKNKLDNGEDVLMKGLGKLVKDTAGKILLIGEDEVLEKKPETTAKKENPKAGTEITFNETDTLPEKPAEIVEKEKDKAKVVKNGKKDKTVAKAESKPEIKEQSEVKPENIEPKAENSTEKQIESGVFGSKSETKPEIKAEQGIKEKAPVKDTVFLKRPEQTKQVAQNDTRDVYSKPAKERKNNSNVILWIILILVVNGLILGWFVFNDRISDIYNKNKKEPVNISTTENQEETPELIIEETTPPVIENNVAEEVINPTTDVKPVAGEKKYYIVAGCFRELDNANSLVEELKKKGYDSQRFGKIGNLHAVSYASFLDKSMANVKLKEIRNSDKEEAWIIYY